MSMFTPPGVGARRPGGSRRRRGVVRHTIVLVLAVLLLVGAGVGAWWFTLRADQSQALPGCPRPTVTFTPPVTPAPAAKVKVNVYNATSRQGLAAQAAKDLRARGFSVGKIANDPLNRTVPGTAEVRYGANGTSAAATVRLQVDGATVVVDARKDASVDLVLGDAWTALRTPEQVAAAASPTPTPAATTTSTARPTCRPQPPVTVTPSIPGAGAGAGAKATSKATAKRTPGSTAAASAKASTKH